MKRKPIEHSDVSETTQWTGVGCITLDCDMARRHGWSEKQINRAARFLFADALRDASDRLHVRKRKGGMNAGWTWALPGAAGAPPSEDEGSPSPHLRAPSVKSPICLKAPEDAPPTLPLTFGDALAADLSSPSQPSSSPAKHSRHQRRPEGAP
jgi:hypothetical protein